MSIKVVLISQVPPPVHGSTLMTSVLLECLSRLKAKTWLINKRFSASVEEIGRFSFRKVLLVVPLLVQVARAAIRRPDAVVLFLTTRRPSFYIDCASLAVLRLVRVPVISYLHTRELPALARASWFASKLVKWALSQSTKVVVLSGTLKSELLTLVDERKVHVISNTLPLGPAPLPRRPGIPKRVIFLANLHPNKGAHIFISAVRPIAEESDYIFEIYGAAGDSTYMDSLRSAVGDGAGGRIKIMGPLEPIDKWRVLAQATLLVYPSINDAQPMVLIEALAAGLPSVAFDVGGVGDMVITGRTGVLLGEHEASAVEEAVRQMLGDELALEKMSDNCRAHFVEQFSLSAYQDNWRTLLRSVRRRELS